MTASHPHDSRTPYLRAQGRATQLIVGGAPFLVIGGELHNSSASSLAYMQPIWERLAGLGLNTVLATVSWELTEPDEGRFDFTLVDGLIHAARGHNLRLILLWFGSWKNGMSSYAPAWVKRDFERFPRARLHGDRPVEVLSTLAEANWQADASAFGALMRHLREVDGSEHTVIMVQVENEVGLLGDSRDRAALAERAFAGPVPQALLDQLGQAKDRLGDQLRQRWESSGYASSGSWEDVFGSGLETDELFMAWNYARYVDQVAAAGKAAYDLPLFANAWLNAEAPATLIPAGGVKPGNYPSGGPLPHTLDIWRAGAPHIDLLAPDIYFGDFEDWCRRYSRRGNPLFIPEMRRDEVGARNVLAAIAEHNAIGVSPFAIDSLEPPHDAPLRQVYALLEQIAPLILAHQGGDSMIGFRLDSQQPRIVRELGGYELEIGLAQGFNYQVEHGHGLIIATGENSFVGAGYGFQVVFRAKTPGPAQVGIAAVEEGEYRQGVWVPGRRLNGDETAGGAWWRFPDPAPGLSPIPVLGSGTGIARCTVYRYE